MFISLESWGICFLGACGSSLKVIMCAINSVKKLWEFPLWLSSLRTQLVSVRIQDWSLASHRGLRIQCFCKLWHSSHSFCGYGVGWQLQLWFDPWPGNFHMPQGQLYKRKKKQQLYIYVCVYIYIYIYVYVYIVVEFYIQNNWLTNSTFKRLFFFNLDIQLHFLPLY